MPVPAKPPVVSIVDQDESVRKSLSCLMRSARLRSGEFSSVEEFLAKVNAREKGCILLDVAMHPYRSQTRSFAVFHLAF